MVMGDQRGIAEQRMAGRMGAPAGGAMPGGGMPPPTAMGGQPPVGAPQGGQPTPGFPEALQQVEQGLMQGNPADLQMFGEFIGRLQQLTQDHQGQGVPQSQPAPAPVAGPGPPARPIP